MTKIATDIKQSQKLIELGIKVNTADMWWLCFDGTITLVAKYEYFDQDPAPEEKTSVIPSWSLAALLDNIPQVKLDNIKQYDKKYWRCCAYFVSDWYNSDWCNNPVDACVEMILKLHEQNLL